MASRFFQGGASDSEYSSSEEELLSSSEEEIVSSEEEQEEEDLSDDSVFGNDSDEESDSDDGGFGRGPAYFLKKSTVPDTDEESSDDEGKKVVKSAKDKLLDEIKGSIAAIDSAKITNDWVSVLAEFEKLARNIVRSEQQSIGTPSSYIRAVVGLDDTITAVSQEEKSSKKKLNASVAKAFNAVRQRVKKSIREKQTLVDTFRANPDAFQNDDALALGSSKATPAPETKTVVNAGLFTAYKAVAESRGKKNVDVYENIKTLEGLVESTTSAYERIIVLLMLIPLRFDSASNMTYMPLDQWNKTAKDINTLFEVLEHNKETYRVVETTEALDDVEQPPKPNAQGVREILGSVVSFVERLDDEFIRSLQVIDPHTTEYIDRLKDEQAIYNTIIRAQLYSEAVIPESQIAYAAGDQIARIVSRRIDHIYYKRSSLIKINESLAAAQSTQQSYIITYADSEDYTDRLLDTLASVLYRQSNAAYRKKAMLCHIYYYAFNNKYFKARDMFLMSHLQSTIHTSDPALQILFNRALVQLGLCAFRNGLIQEAHQALQEIATSQRHRELLGQSTQRFTNQTPAAEKQRVLPFHTHINLELMESVFLTSSLLIEIPQYAQLGSSADAKKRLQTRSFRRFLEFHERQTFQGPPEGTRDYIMHAAKSLQSGEWKKAVDLLVSIKIWNLFPESDTIKEMIKEKIQVEGLRTFLFQFKSFYSKLSIAKLSQLFELPESKVSAVVSKMIFSEEIAAGLDQVSNSIIFTKGVELTKLQELALSLADKAQNLSDRNERLAGAHQPQSYSSDKYNSGADGKRDNRHNNRNSNFKFAPVTGALSSAPATISGALNGMDKRKRTTRV
jgi:translation initiation factor 3 subunit C